MCVVLCCSGLYCVALCCILLQCVAKRVADLIVEAVDFVAYLKEVCVLYCVAVGCIFLQCVVFCCSVLPCVAMCCRSNS